MSKSPPPISVVPEVFAYCIHVGEAHDYAIYRVAAKRTSDGSVVRLDSPQVDFPNKGTVRLLLRNLRSGSRRGNHAFLQLEEDEHFEALRDSPKGIKYRASAVLPSGIELVAVPLTLNQHDEIAELLRSGLSVLGEPNDKANVLLELSGGTVVGPFSLRAVPDSHKYRADEAALHNLKSGWKSAAALPIVTLEMDHRTHRFVFRELPAAEFGFDASPATFAIKRALEFVAEQKTAENIISKNKARDVATVLAKLRPPQELKARCERVLALLENYTLANEEAAQFMKLALDTPTVKAQLEKEMTLAREQAKEAVNTELKTIRDQVKASRGSLKLVEEERAQVRAEIAAGEKKIADTEKRYREVEEAFAKKLFAQVEKAKVDTADLLASVTMLQPFLRADATRPVVAEVQPPPPAAPPPIASSMIAGASQRMPITWRTQMHPNALIDARDLFSLLQQNLAIAGVREPGASRVAAICLAAFSAGQAVSVRGSAAVELSRAIAVAYFGAQWAEISVPVGYADQEELVGLRPTVGEIGGVLVLGANRSCLNAYAGEWVAPYRMGGRVAVSFGYPVVFTLSEGPSALGPTPQFSELGPVIHSDALGWTSGQSAKLSPGAFKGRIAAKPVDADAEIKLLENAFATSPNISAQLAVRAAFPLLVELCLQRNGKLTEDQAIKEGLALATAGWVVPALRSSGAKRDSLAQLEQAVGDDKLCADFTRVWFGAFSEE